MVDVIESFDINGNSNDTNNENASGGNKSWNSIENKKIFKIRRKNLDSNMLVEFLKNLVNFNLLMNSNFTILDKELLSYPC